MCSKGEGGQNKMVANEINLKVGQVVSTMGGQITVPDWHEIWTVGQESMRIGDMPCIRLKCGFSHGMASDVRIAENWNINTNSYNQSGLVCFVPERYLGMAVLSVQIVAIRNKAVVAQPIEWIEVNPRLPPAWIGKNAQEIFDAFMLAWENHKEVRAIWHNSRGKL